MRPCATVPFNQQNQHHMCTLAIGGGHVRAINVGTASPPLRTSSRDCDGLRATPSRMSASGFRSSATTHKFAGLRRTTRYPEQNARIGFPVLRHSAIPKRLFALPAQRKRQKNQCLAAVACGRRCTGHGALCLCFSRFSPNLWTAGAEVRRRNRLIYIEFLKPAPAYFFTGPLAEEVENATACSSVVASLNFCLRRRGSFFSRQVRILDTDFWRLSRFEAEVPGRNGRARTGDGVRVPRQR
jgi:hypothetical protein